MTKIKSLDLLKWLVWTLIAAYGLGYVTILTIDTVVNDLPESLYSCVPSLLVTISLVVFYYRQLDRLDNHLPVKEKRELKATNARSITVNGTKQIFLSQVSSIFQSELPEPTHVLWWRYGPYTIREDTAYEWLRKGWNRQLKQEPHPFSGNWMIHQRFHTLGNQRIKRPYHDAICMLMSDYQLWRKEPSQGASGEVLAHPAACVAKLKGKW